MDCWRLIQDPAMTGGENMAVDDAILTFAEKSLAPVPTLRLYSWSSPVISIGSLQDASPFDGSGVPVIRRVTGGRAILHDRELTYSIIASTGMPVFAGGITGAYSAIAGCITAALQDIGVPAAFSGARSLGAAIKSPACFCAPSRYEITAGGKKISGSAQRRLKRAFLQHGSILFDVDKDMYIRVFGKDVLGSTAWLSSLLPPESGGIFEAFKESLVKRFAACLGAVFTLSGLTPEEEYLKESLLRECYLNPDWNLRRRCAPPFAADSGVSAL